MVKVFVFPLSIWAKDTNGENFCFFFVNFGQGYQWWKFCLVLAIFGQGYQRWKFLFFMEIFGQGYFYWPLQLWIPMMKVMFVIWDFEQPLASRSAKREFAFAGDNLWNPTVQQEFALRVATAGMGLQVRVYSYTGRQALARKYEYTRTPVGKRWHESTSILVHR